MNYTICYYWLLFLLLPTMPFIASDNNNNQSKFPFAYPTFSNWKEAIDKLPLYRDTKENHTNKPEQLTKEELKKTIGLYTTLMKDILNKGPWVNNEKPTEQFFKKHSFLPFTQKLELPEGTKISLHGDLHGDVHSLILFLHSLKEKGFIDDSFKIIIDNFYIIFLGDYVDRGNFGSEVLYTLLYLKVMNPEKVILVRGNHEDFNLNTAMSFSQEVKTKFNEPNDEFLKYISQIYEFMPVALYLGTKTHLLQCNHGGMEIGYLPHKLLGHNSSTAFEIIKTLKLRENSQRIAKANIEQLTYEQLEFEVYTLCNNNKFKIFELGFLWDDFLINKNEYFKTIEGRGNAWGKELTLEILKTSGTPSKQLVGVIRAHQHSSTLTDMMAKILYGPTPGVAKLWNANEEKQKELWHGMVATLNVTPDTPYGKSIGFKYDTHALLKLGKNFPDDWRLKIKRLEREKTPLSNKN